MNSLGSDTLGLGLILFISLECCLASFLVGSDLGQAFEEATQKFAQFRGNAGIWRENPANEILRGELFEELKTLSNKFNIIYC